MKYNVGDVVYDNRDDSFKLILTVTKRTYCYLENEFLSIEWMHASDLDDCEEVVKVGFNSRMVDEYNALHQDLAIMFATFDTEKN